MTVTTLVTLGGWLAAGGLAVFGLFNMTARQRRKESDDLADGLIKRLQQTVDQQAADLKRMQDEMTKHTQMRDSEIKELSGKVSHLQGRNSVLEDILKGRDPLQSEFFKASPKLFEIATENNRLAKETSEAISELVDAIEKILPHLPVITT
jgi:uncharacterized protein YPO0396